MCVLLVWCARVPSDASRGMCALEPLQVGAYFRSSSEERLKRLALCVYSRKRGAPPPELLTGGRVALAGPLRLLVGGHQLDIRVLRRLHERVHQQCPRRIPGQGPELGRRGIGSSHVFRSTSTQESCMWRSLSWQRAHGPRASHRASCSPQGCRLKRDVKVVPVVEERRDVLPTPAKVAAPRYLHRLAARHLCCADARRLHRLAGGRRVGVVRRPPSRQPEPIPQ